MLLRQHLHECCLLRWPKSVNFTTTFSISSRQFQFPYSDFNFIVGYYPDGNGPQESRRVFPVPRQVGKNSCDRIEIAVVKMKLP